jgi:hypothetical protein
MAVEEVGRLWSFYIESDSADLEYLFGGSSSYYFYGSAGFSRAGIIGVPVMAPF